MGAKTVRSSKSAEELMKEQQAAAINAVHPDLEKARAVAKKMHETGVTSLEGDPAAFLAPSTAPPTISEIAAVVSDNIKPLLPKIDREFRFKFKLRDGRECSMGEPAQPHLLIVPDILDSLGEMGNSKFLSLVKLCKVMQYIRQFNGQTFPGNLLTWKEVENLAVALGDNGVKAIYDVYEQFWPDDGSKLWENVKNE